MALTGAKPLTHLNSAGFPCTIWPQDDGDRPGGGFKRHIVDSDQVAVADCEIFDKNGHASTLRTNAS